MNGFINLTQTNNKEISNLGIKLNYNGNTGELEISLIHRNAVIGTAKVDLPLELLISSGYYNSANKELVLVLANNETISIPVADLIDEYYADNTTLELIDVDGKQTFKVKDKGISSSQLSDEVLQSINDKQDKIAILKDYGENGCSFTFENEGHSESVDITPDGFTYNGKEVATVDDIENAINANIITVLNTEV